MIRGVMIDVNTYDVSEVSLPEARSEMLEAIRRCLDCEAVTVGAVLANGDRLYVNANAIFESLHYFKHPLVKIPLPGSAVLVGSISKDDAADAKSLAGVLRELIVFLDRWDALEWMLTMPEEDPMPFRALAA